MSDNKNTTNSSNDSKQNDNGKTNQENENSKQTHGTMFHLHFPEQCLEELSEPLLDMIDLVDTVFDTTESTIPETIECVKRFIDSDPRTDNIGFVYKLVFRCMDIRAKYRRTFASLLLSLVSIHGHKEILNTCLGSKQCMLFLLREGLLDKKDFPFEGKPTDEEIFELYPQNSIGSFMVYDDIDGFQQYTSKTSSFNFNEPFQFDAFMPISKLGGSTYNKPFTIACAAAFYGATKIFKFLVLNQAELTSNFTPFAIAGGDTEIIHIFEEKNIKFHNNCFKAASVYHRNSIFQWLLMHFIGETVDTHGKDTESKNINDLVPTESKALIEFNMNSFFFCNKNFSKYRDQFAVNAAVVTSNIKILEWLRDQNNDYDIFNVHTLGVAIVNGSIDCAKMIMEKVTDFDDPELIRDAVQYNDANILKMLIEKGAKVQSNDKLSLDIACRNQNIEIVKLLLSNGAKVTELEKETAKNTGNQELIALLK